MRLALVLVGIGLLFAVQDEIAKDVVTALRVKLLPEKAKGERKTTSLRPLRRE